MVLCLCVQQNPYRISRFSKSSPLRNLILVDNLLACDFLDQQSPAIALPTQLGYTTQLAIATPAFPPAAAETLPTLLQLFIRGNPFRGSAGVTHIAQDWFTKLLQTANLQALVLYGSPDV